MLRIREGKFVFDGKINRHDPNFHLKDLWFREDACAKAYVNWLESMQDMTYLERAQWCLAAHNLNAKKLHDRIVLLGDDVNWLDNWRLLVGVKDLVATSLGETIALTDLRQMEESLLEEYMAKLMNFDGDNLELLQNELMPVQHQCAQAW